MQVVSTPKTSNGNTGQCETHECFFCKKKRHLKKDCRAFKWKLEVDKTKKEKQPDWPESKASMVFDPEELDNAFAAQYSTTTSTNTWFVNSRASNYVTS